MTMKAVYRPDTRPSSLTRSRPVLLDLGAAGKRRLNEVEATSMLHSLANALERLYAARRVGKRGEA